MTWEMAFTVVGCVWAAVVLFVVRTARHDELERRIGDCEKQWVAQSRDIEFLKEVWRKLARSEGGAS